MPGRLAAVVSEIQPYSEIQCEIHLTDTSARLNEIYRA